MTYLKKALLATSLVATTLGMSLSANAGAIIQQDIYADVLFSDFNPFSIDLGPQVIGSVTYNTEDADGAGFLNNVEVDLTLGLLSLTMDDSESTQFDLDIVAGINPFDPTAGLEFMVEVFNLFGDTPNYVLTLDIGNYEGIVLIDEIFYDQDDNIEEIFLDALGFTSLGKVTYVPEPSALILMLAGLGLLARRKIAAK